MKNIEVYTKMPCPFCDKAKSLLKSKGLVFVEIPVTDPTQLPKPEFRTVPQIVIDGEFIGGFTQLETYIRSPVETGKTVEKSTVFNKNNIGYVTGDYPLFLGPELGFADSINNPYPVIDELYDQQMAQIWNHTEIDLTQDRQDMLSAPPEVVDLMVQNLTWQTLADSVASRAIGSVLTKHVSNSALQDLYNAIILFESIHSKTYLHIIRQTFIDPNEALKQGYANVEAIKRSDILVNSFDNLANSGSNDVKQLRKLVLFCVVAMYLLERVNFMSSFACTFAIAERGYFQGISQDVILICRDEILHARAGKSVLGILRAQWPELFEELKPELEKIIHAVEQDEYAFNNYLFSNGRQVIGLNANLLNEYVRYNMVDVRNTVLGTNLSALPNPLPYMDNYIDTSRIQSAAQEIQLTAYLVNSVKASTEEEVNQLLAKLRNKYL